MHLCGSLNSPLALCVLFAFRTMAVCQILDVRDLNVDDIRSLDRQRTAVIVPGGILEEHGPYLPLYTDGWAAEYLTRELAQAIVARPGWKVLVFPAIPLGTGGANEIGRKYSFPGTFAVRPAILRAVYMDVAAELGEQGFRWVFLVHGHAGSPSNNRALYDASDFYRDVYGYTMVHLCGLMPVAQAVLGAQTRWNEEAQRENGLFIHSDMVETSWMLYLRPAAVRSTYATAQSRPGATIGDIVQLAEQTGWPGYFGAPRLATASHGAQAIEEYARAVTKLALDILDGADPRNIPRYADAMKDVPEQVRIDAAAAAYDAERERKQREWLGKRDRYPARGRARGRCNTCSPASHNHLRAMRDADIERMRRTRRPGTTGGSGAQGIGNGLKLPAEFSKPSTVQPRGLAGADLLRDIGRVSGSFWDDATTNAYSNVNVATTGGMALTTAATCVSQTLWVAPGLFTAAFATTSSNNLAGGLILGLSFANPDLADPDAVSVLEGGEVTCADAGCTTIPTSRTILPGAHTITLRHRRFGDLIASARRRRSLRFDLGDGSAGGGGGRAGPDHAAENTAADNPHVHHSRDAYHKAAEPAPTSSYSMGGGTPY